MAESVFGIEDGTDYLVVYLFNRQHLFVYVALMPRLVCRLNVDNYYVVIFQRLYRVQPLVGIIRIQVASCARDVDNVPANTNGDASD